MPYRDNARKKAYNKQYAEANKDVIAQRQKEYYEAKKDALCADARVRHAANRERNNARSREWRAKNRAKILRTLQRNREALKAQAVALLGSKCWMCGISVHLASYDFHHLDASQKDFGPSRLFGEASHLTDQNKAWLRVAPEVQKCALLCANCHNEWHWEDDRGNRINITPK